MESSIKIDFRHNGTGLAPVIAIKLIDSEDPRDGLLKAFFQELGGSSSWLAVSFDHHVINGVQDAKTFITISPVVEKDLLLVSEEMQRRMTTETDPSKDDKTGYVNHNPIKERYL